MPERAVAAKLPFRWVTGDEVYGQDRVLRGWLAEQRLSYVLVISCTHTAPLPEAPESGPPAAFVTPDQEKPKPESSLREAVESLIEDPENAVKIGTAPKEYVRTYHDGAYYGTRVLVGFLN
ncbi:transposase [Streptomyces azureus]|uniref:Transposase n=1 Tax=Streptomyces azureus TaxID=146537 RepID=A0A0K8PMC4_STRAJ|nr:transposase [Streptomyces azureus]